MHRSTDGTAQNELKKKKRKVRFSRRLKQGKKLGNTIHYSQIRILEEDWPTDHALDAGRKGHIAVKVPVIFSFIEEPEQTIAFLDRLAGEMKSRRVRTLHVDHSGCKKLDLCASLLMDTLIDKRWRSHQLGLGGTFSNEERVNLMLRASGLLERIKHPASVIPPALKAKVRVSALHSGYSKFSEKSSRCDLASTDLTDYFSNCLGMVGCELSREGKKQLSTLISEAISNAEEHSRGKWYAKAHYDRLRPEEQEGGACHIVLVNLGPTIMDSFQGSKSTPEIYKRISDYARKHLSSGIFKKPYDEEALCTLYALQEGISSLPQRRGTGTTNLIDFFLRLAGNKPRMCVVSGRAYILFDGKYQLKKELFAGGDRMVIAFNGNNSLDEPPNGAYVRSLSGRFPGTLISIKFNLKESYAVAG